VEGKQHWVEEITDSDMEDDSDAEEEKKTSIISMLQRKYNAMKKNYARWDWYRSIESSSSKEHKNKQKNQLRKKQKRLWILQ
jgi:hypothetical protein